MRLCNFDSFITVSIIHNDNINNTIKWNKSHQSGLHNILYDVVEFN